jgi:hypothetical protein
MECNVLKNILRLLIACSLVTVVACSRGGLYEGEDVERAFSPAMIYDAEEQSFGLGGSYGFSTSLFFGAGSDYDEVTIFSRFSSYPSVDDTEDIIKDENETVDASMTQVTRYLIRQKEPIDLQRIILQPQDEFDPFAGADCVLTLKGSLQKEDQCEGAAKCKLYRVENIFANKSRDTCNFPTVKSFVAKFDSSMQTAEVVQPGTDSWIPINRINYFDTKSQAIRLSSEEDLFSSVVATASSKGYVFAGKRYNQEIISASFPDKVGTMLFRKEDLEGVSTAPFFEKAQTRNVLLAVTSSGFFKLNSEDKWESVALPAGLSAMPANVKKAYAASGIGVAAFRFIYNLAGSEKNLILAYRESSNAVEVIDHSSIALDQSSPPDTIPSSWAMTIVNDSVWFWNQQAPTLSKKFDDIEKKWLPVALTLPVMAEAETLPKYIVSPAGAGFVLTLSYPQKVSIKSRFAAETVDTVRQAFRHFFYDGNGDAQGTPVNTFSAPDAMHVRNGKIYFERVRGIDSYGGSKVMDYGYIYDFVSGTGKIFKDSGFDTGNQERLADFAGILVNDDQSVLFYGGCEKPADIQQCLSANPLARLVEFTDL